MQQLENDLDQVQEQLLKANTQLEEKDKALQNVSEAFSISRLVNKVISVSTADFHENSFRVLNKIFLQNPLTSIDNFCPPGFCSRIAIVEEGTCSSFCKTPQALFNLPTNKCIINYFTFITIDYIISSIVYQILYLRKY